MRESAAGAVEKMDEEGEEEGREEEEAAKGAEAEVNEAENAGNPGPGGVGGVGGEESTADPTEEVGERGAGKGDPGFDPAPDLEGHRSVEGKEMKRKAGTNAEQSAQRVS